MVRNLYAISTHRAHVGDTVAVYLGGTPKGSPVTIYLGIPMSAATPRPLFSNGRGGYYVTSSEVADPGIVIVRTIYDKKRLAFSVPPGTRTGYVGVAAGRDSREDLIRINPAKVYLEVIK